MVTYLFTVTLVGISILLLYRYMFYIKSFWNIMVVRITTYVIWGVSLGAANIFQRHRVLDVFKVEVAGALDGRRIDLRAMFYGALGTGFALDFTILVPPLLQIWGLRPERRQKLELTAILSLGGLYAIFACSSQNENDRIREEWRHTLIPF